MYVCNVQPLRWKNDDRQHFFHFILCESAIVDGDVDVYTLTASLLDSFFSALHCMIYMKRECMKWTLQTNKFADIFFIMGKNTKQTI